MARVDEYRDQAGECLDRAKRTVDIKSKLELLGIAVAWLDLADMVERSATSVIAAEPPSRSPAPLTGAA